MGKELFVSQAPGRLGDALELWAPGALWMGLMTADKRKQQVWWRRTKAHSGTSSFYLQYDDVDLHVRDGEDRGLSWSKDGQTIRRATQTHMCPQVLCTVPAILDLTFFKPPTFSSGAHLLLS